MKKQHSDILGLNQDLTEEQKLLFTRARRTAFVARFIVLREAKRSKAHRAIEQLVWQDDTSAEDLCEMLRKAFVENKDNIKIVERDLRRALAHVGRSVSYFVKEYSARATTDFIGALHDYDRSNRLLFSSDEQPRPGGWRLPQDLEREKLNVKEIMLQQPQRWTAD